MQDITLSTHLENLDHRVERIEQILPTLATKDDLASAIAPLATKEELRVAIAPLATREEMHRAIDKAVAPLATREEMHRTIQEVVAPLATKEALGELRQELAAQKSELRHEIREEGERLSRRMDVLIEQQRSDTQLIAEHLSAVMLKLTDR